MNEAEQLEWQKESLGRYLWEYRDLWMNDEQKAILIAREPKYAKIWPNIKPAELNERPVYAPKVNLAQCEHIGPGTGCRTRKCAKGHGGEVGVRACTDCGPQCKDYSPDNATESLEVLIDQGASGIGDGLQGLLAVGALKKRNPELHVTYHVGPAARPFVALFDGYDELGIHAKGHSEDPVPGARQMNLGYLAECVHRIQRPRWERYAENIGTIGYVQPSLKEPNRLAELGKELAGYVLLCPFSTERSREYSTQHWLHLVDLLHAAGYKVAVIHNTMDRMEPFRNLTMLVGATADVVAGSMLNAACVIGLDSGMSHLSAIMGFPTIVLGGSTPVQQIFGCYPRVKCLQGGLGCSGCCNGWPADDRCRMSCGNIQSINPRDIVAEVDRIWLSEKLTVGRTLVDHKRLGKIRDCVLQTNHLKGDLAEFGTYLGGTAKMMGYYALGSTIHIYDTFTGIPDDDEHGEHRKGDFATNEAEVRGYLGSEQFKIHAGFFPDTADHSVKGYRLVHIDADTFQSTRAAIIYFSDLMVRGGIMVFDDFNWYRTPGVAKALYEAFSPERIIQGNGHQAIVKF